MEFEDYAHRFSTLALRREDGVIELRVHTDDGPFRWSRTAHAELAEAFSCIAHDEGNRVMVLTGTGDVFSGPSVEAGGTRRDMGPQNAKQWNSVFVEGRRLLLNLLDIEIPVIGAINGPAYRHPELPLLSDVVIASDTTLIQDAAHMRGGLVPGDGVHIAFPALMGLTRARYFLITGQVLDAQQAFEFGLVNEIVPAASVTERAWEVARSLLTQEDLVLRYTRLLLTDSLKERMRQQLGYGIALEGLAVLGGNPPADV